MDRDIGVYGLGVMGQNLSLNAASQGFRIAVSNRCTDGEDNAVTDFLKNRCKDIDIQGYESLDSFVESLSIPRKIIIMVKAGEAVNSLIGVFLPLLSEGDVIIDGGNSNYLDTERHFHSLRQNGIEYLGCGISGGSEGALHGPSIMVGGSADGWHIAREFLTKIAASFEGTPCCGWIGSGGAGHFVKMVHNGIEYALMQSIAEIYDLYKKVLKADCKQIKKRFDIWQSGELKSYLLHITCELLGMTDKSGRNILESIVDSSSQKGTGKDCSIAALDLGIPANMISESVYARYQSADKILRGQIASIFSDQHTPSTSLNTGLLEQSLYCAQLLAYAQGLFLIKRASSTYSWNIDLVNVTQIWRAGCIVQSQMLTDIANVIAADGPEALLLSEPFMHKLKECQGGLRRTVTAAIQSRVPVPVLSAGLSWFDSLQAKDLPANLIQGQRDYFGAHGFEMAGHPAGQLFHLR